MKIWKTLLVAAAVAGIVGLGGCSGEKGNISANTSAQPEGVRLPIIMYHHITEQAGRVNDYTVSAQGFADDLNYLRERGYHTVTVSRLLDSQAGGAALPENPIMLTFDDGFESTYVYAYPLLREYGFQAVLSVVGAYADRYTENPDHRVQYSCCDWQEIAEMEQSGVIEIQSHTDSLHEISGGRKGCARKKGESEEEYRQLLRRDLETMQQKLTQHIGRPAQAIAYPFGSFSALTREVAAEAGLTVAFTCEEKISQVGAGSDGLYSLGRFNRRGKLSTAEFFSRIETK